MPDKKTILVIDDDVQLVDSVKTLLESAGYTVEYAYQAEKGIELARQLMLHFDGMVDVEDEVYGFRYFDERDLLGFVDGTENPHSNLYTQKMHEVQKYMTMANYTTAQFVVQANLGWWEKLSQAEKDVILKAGLDAEAWIRQGSAEDLQKGDLYTARLTLDITPAMRARIKVSAFTQGVTVAELLRGLLEREFPENTP